jgi:hypothetical protein
MAVKAFRSKKSARLHTFELGEIGLVFAITLTLEVATTGGWVVTVLADGFGGVCFELGHVNECFASLYKAHEPLRRWKVRVAVVNQTMREQAASLSGETENLLRL